MKGTETTPLLSAFDGTRDATSLRTARCYKSEGHEILSRGTQQTTPTPSTHTGTCF